MVNGLFKDIEVLKILDNLSWISLIYYSFKMEECQMFLQGLMKKLI